MLALFDWILIALIVLCCINGIWQGVYIELLGLVHFMLALLIATAIHVVVIPEVLYRLSQTYFNSNIVYGVGLVVIFIVCWLILKVLFAVLLLMTGSSNTKNPLTRILGGCMGILKGGALIVLIIMAIDYTFVPDQKFWQESFIIEKTTPFAYQVRDGLAFIDDFARQNIQELIDPADIPLQLPDSNSTLGG